MFKSSLWIPPPAVRYGGRVFTLVGNFELVKVASCGFAAPLDPRLILEGFRPPDPPAEGLPHAQARWFILGGSDPQRKDPDDPNRRKDPAAEAQLRSSRLTTPF